MNRRLLVALAVMPMFGTVHAADLAQPNAKTIKNETSSAAYWDGFYTGLSLGWAKIAIKGNTLATDGTASDRTARESADQIARISAGSFFMGMQKQVTSLAVLGVEGDFSKLGGRSRHTDTVISGNIWTGQPSAELSYRTPWLATGRVKLGIAVGQSLVYATGGIAIASERETRTQFVGNQVTNLTDISFIESDQKLRTGFALGGGVEWRILQTWSVRAEYLHNSFAGKTFMFPNARSGVVPTGGYTSVQGRLANNQSRIDIGRVGISYHF